MQHVPDIGQPGRIPGALEGYLRPDLRSPTVREHDEHKNRRTDIHDCLRKLNVKDAWLGMPNGTCRGETILYALL